MSSSNEHCKLGTQTIEKLQADIKTLEQQRKDDNEKNESEVKYVAVEHAKEIASTKELSEAKLDELKRALGDAETSLNERDQRSVSRLLSFFNRI